MILRSLHLVCALMQTNFRNFIVSVWELYCLGFSLTCTPQSKSPGIVPWSFLHASNISFMALTASAIFVAWPLWFHDLFNFDAIFHVNILLS